MNHSNTSLLYALACVLLPMVWGLLMVAVVGRLERTLASRCATHPAVPGDSGDRAADPTPEYHI